MAKKIFECIINFSEGRDQRVIDAILGELKSVQVLDQHSDVDHNRTVITILGIPESIEDAVFQAIKKAAELIDMNTHTGEHPRIGATDVVPFVPIQNMTIKECVAMAERLGKRVGNELNIPVSLYEDAARLPYRKNLEKVRKGQFEGLKEEITHDPDRKPDFGPSELGSAGATVIGARVPLIAFNVYLASEDVAVAKKIARTVRDSSGGLRFVKAMGVLVDGRAQVSMNLTNFNKTAIHRVVEMIRREAASFGIAVHHSELVGLIPQKALIDSAIWYLQLDQFSDEHILENKLSSLESREQFEFLDALASKEPTPGGGSAAAFAGAQAAALVAMVGRLTIGKKKYADVQGEMTIMVEQAEKLREELADLIQLDADAFVAVMSAYKLPKDKEEEQNHRTAVIQDAMRQAAQVPLETCRKALQVMELANSAAEKGNQNAITDAGSGSVFAMAAIRSAGANVRVNLQALKNPGVKREISDELEKIEDRATVLEEQIKSRLETRAKIKLL